MYILLLSCVATPCNDRRPLLDGEVVDLEVPFHLLFGNDRITSSSHTQGHSPSEARMSRNGWCAEMVCPMETQDHYLQVDFGAEVVVGAIAIGSVDNNLYVTRFYVEYGLDENQLYCVTSEAFNETVSVYIAIILPYR